MAARPWVAPEEVAAYSDNPAVQNRAPEKLKIDISRAELYVMQYTGNKFDGNDYTEIPEAVKTAVILLAETYAAAAAEMSEKSGSYKSENFDDYSYTAADTAFKIQNLNLSPLLDEYKVRRSSFNMKLRKL